MEIKPNVKLIHSEGMDSIQVRMNDFLMRKADLARALGLNNSYVTKLFKSETLLNLKMLGKLETVLDAKITIIVTPNKMK